MYSKSGQRLISPMYRDAGGAASGVGSISPFGTQFGRYSDAGRGPGRAAPGAPGYRPAHSHDNLAAVTFTLQRDGSVQQSSIITAPSGISALDFSAKRAILQAAPFGPLPPQFSRLYICGGTLSSISS